MEQLKIKPFEDSSSYSDTASTRNSMYSNSSYSQLSPPLPTTPTKTRPNCNVPPPIRPKTTRSILSLSAQEFVPSSPTFYAHPVNPFGVGTTECQFTNAGANSRDSIGSGSYQLPLNMSASLNLLSNQAQNHLMMQRQQILQEKQQILQRQQEIAAATVAKQQLILSVAAAAKNPQDEIANSLKMYAFLSACKGNETSQSHVDEVMQEFASNGQTTDDLNRQYQAAASMQFLANTNVFPNPNNFHNYDPNLNPLNSNINNMNLFYNQQQFLHDLNNFNAYNELWRQHFFQLLPAHLMRQAEAANAATNVNMDYNRQNVKPYKKPYHKKDVQLTARRCVFCDNNKEPEAVVKSHAVRDSQGRVLCPKLRVYVCPICKASGDDAHTVKYCPQKPIITMEDAIKAESERIHKNGRYSQAKPS